MVDRAPFQSDRGALTFDEVGGRRASVEPGRCLLVLGGPNAGEIVGIRGVNFWKSVQPLSKATKNALREARPDIAKASATIKPTVMAGDV